LSLAHFLDLSFLLVFLLVCLLRHPQDEAGEFPLAEESPAAGLAAATLEARGGGLFFRRAFVGRTMAPRAFASPVVAASAASADPTALPWADFLLTGPGSEEPGGVGGACGVRDSAAAAHALRGRLPSFLRVHSAGAALLRAGMVRPAESRN
jgi:hypothetical protein